MRHSAICCKNMHGHRFEGGAAGERVEFRKTASEGESDRSDVAGIKRLFTLVLNPADKILSPECSHTQG